MNGKGLEMKQCRMGKKSALESFIISVTLHLSATDGDKLCKKSRLRVLGSYTDNHVFYTHAPLSVVI
jgi:hypothetical protein